LKAATNWGRSLALTEDAPLAGTTADPMSGSVLPTCRLKSVFPFRKRKMETRVPLVVTIVRSSTAIPSEVVDATVHPGCSAWAPTVVEVEVEVVGGGVEETAVVGSPVEVGVAVDAAFGCAGEQAVPTSETAASATSVGTNRAGPARLLDETLTTAPSPSGRA
jgi:hypothetical protein